MSQKVSQLRSIFEKKQEPPPIVPRKPSNTLNPLTSKILTTNSTNQIVHPILAKSTPNSDKEKNKTFESKLNENESNHKIIKSDKIVTITPLRSTVTQNNDIKIEENNVKKNINPIRNVVTNQLSIPQKIPLKIEENKEEPKNIEINQSSIQFKFSQNEIDEKKIDQKLLKEEKKEELVNVKKNSVFQLARQRFENLNQASNIKNENKKEIHKNVFNTNLTSNQKSSILLKSNEKEDNSNNNHPIIPRRFEEKKDIKINETKQLFNTELMNTIQLNREEKIVEIKNDKIEEQKTDNLNQLSQVQKIKLNLEKDLQKPQFNSNNPNLNTFQSFSDKKKLFERDLPSKNPYSQSFTLQKNIPTNNISTRYNSANSIDVSEIKKVREIQFDYSNSDSNLLENVLAKKNNQNRLEIKSINRASRRTKNFSVKLNEQEIFKNFK